MKLLRSFFSRFAALFHRSARDRDFAAEMDSHLRLHIDENLARGMDPAEARRQALIRLGGLAQTTEHYRARRGLPFLETLAQDVRYALRMLAKSPGFTAVAVLTLALGIGATTAIFSVVNAVLLQALPYHNSNRLMLVREKLPKFFAAPLSVSAPDIAVMARENRVFTGVAAFTGRQLNLAGAGAPQRIIAARTSANLFPVLETSPVIGRIFHEGEDQAGHFVTVLSYGLWQRRFGGDPGAVGRSITLDGQPYTVIGVMPQGFEFPPRGLPQYEPADLWIPMALSHDELADVGDNFDWGVIGRLNAGLTLDQAQSDMNIVMADVLKMWGLPPAMKVELDAVVTPLREVVVSNVETLMYLLLGAVGLLLLIACANVANLLLARTSGRRKEIAIRAALGAPRGRVIRQLLTESLLLALFGGALGIFAAIWGTKLLAALAPDNIPQVQGITVDHTVLLFAALLSGVTGVLFGLAPAFAASRAEVTEILKEEGRLGAGGRSGISARSAFVVAQIAIAFVLVIGGGLLIRSFIEAQSSAPGVQPENILTATISLPPTQYSQSARAEQFFQQLTERLEGTPGMEAIGFSSDLPTEMDWDHIFVVEEHPTFATAQAPHSANSIVLGNYFQTLGVPLIRGRFFTAEEEKGQARVLIISAGMAKQYWPGEDPIGKRVKWGAAESKDPWLTVIGVVGDVKQGALDEPTLAHTYEPYLSVCSQKDAMQNSLCNTLDIAVRSHVPPASVLSGLQAALHGIDPAEPLTRVRTLQDVVESSIAPRRFNTFLLTIFACAALLLSSIGLYGVISYAVGQRTHEIGIRIALGAQRPDVLRLVIRQGILLVLAGSAIGIGAAMSLTRFMSSMLYGIHANDPLTFAGVAILLTIVALAACYIPARRAMRVDPMIALRHE
ncbi:MAG TPA: ABC transporter permease [Candidatus Acidoferrales bacterium]|nr:ABC transporter permease [Candidatus Acidoferrales bacterium]